MKMIKVVSSTIVASALALSMFPSTQAAETNTASRTVLLIILMDKLLARLIGLLMVVF